MCVLCLARLCAGEFQSIYFHIMCLVPSLGASDFVRESLESGLNQSSVFSFLDEVTLRDNEWPMHRHWAVNGCAMQCNGLALACRIAC